MILRTFYLLCLVPLVASAQYVEKQSITLSAGLGYIHGFLYQSGKLWACTETTPSHVVRFNNPANNLSDYTVLDFANDGLHNDSRQIIYVPSKGKFYVIFHGFASSVVVSEVDPVTLASTDVISTASTDQQGETLCASSTNLFILVHVITGSTGYGGVIKYLLSNWSETGRVTLGNSGLIGTQPHSMQFDNTNIYVTGASSPGWVAKVDPVSLAFTTQSFVAGDNIPTDDFGMTTSNLWVGLEAMTGILVRVNKSDLSLSRLSTGILDSYSFGVFNDGTYIWNLIPFSPNGIVQRINPINTNIVNVDTEAVPNEIDTDGTNYFLTTFSNPSKVFELSAQTTNLVVKVKNLHVKKAQTQ